MYIETNYGRYEGWKDEVRFIRWELEDLEPNDHKAREVLNKKLRKVKDLIEMFEEFVS